MPQFNVDEDLAALVERLAKPKPFENLSFNSALRRVLQSHIGHPKTSDRDEELEQLLAEAMAAAKASKKTPSPSAAEWVAAVPELKAKRGLSTWKAICNALRIDTAGDSARRKLKNWVKANRPSWPPVPDID